MKKSLNNGTQEFETFGLVKDHPAGQAVLADRAAAGRVLRTFVGDPEAMRTLREGLARTTPGAQVWRMDNHQLLARVEARLLEDPDAMGIAQREEVNLGGTGTKQEEAAQAGGASPSQIKSATTKPWIKFQVVDDNTNVPLGNVALIVKDPGGWLKEYVTDGKGMVEIPKTEQGAHTVSNKREGSRLATTLQFVVVQQGAPVEKPANMLAGPPWKILFVENHKVKTSDSILSLATKAGMTWQELSIFNWGTSNPDEINKHLAADVGCTNKVDQWNYRFDDKDDPGIMYIPTDWSMDGLNAEQTHLIRVHSDNAYEIKFLLVSKDTGHILPYHDFAVYDEGDNVIASGKTNAEGIGFASVADAGDYRVVFDPTGTFSVSGAIYGWDAATPLEDISAEAEDWAGNKFQIKSGADGEFSITGVAFGELTIKHGESTVFVMVNDNLTGVRVILRDVDPTPPGQGESDDHAYEDFPPPEDALPPPDAE